MSKDKNKIIDFEKKKKEKEESIEKKKRREATKKLIKQAEKLDW